MKAKSINLFLFLLLTTGLTFQSCTIVGAAYGTIDGFNKKKALTDVQPVDLQVTLEALDTIDKGTKLKVLLKDGRFFKGRFQAHTMVEFPNMTPYNELLLKEKGKIIKIKTDKTHKVVIPAKKKKISPIAQGLAWGTIGLVIDAILIELISVGI